jgi:acyl-CoA synthetase (AMP-forming)/AMP-acid ligase II/fermentation-respiration switch protein FrsA (DUF1100 family)
MLRLANIPAYLAHWSDETPEAEALCVVSRRPRALSYRTLGNRVAALAHRLSEEGVRPEDCVAILCNQDDRLVTALLAASSLGAIGLPITMKSAASRHALAEYHRHYPLKVICETGYYRSFAEQASPDLRGVKLLAIDQLERLPLPDQRQLARWKDWVAVRRGDQPFYVNHTSGSTSNPKIVLPTDDQLLANAYAGIEYLRVDQTSRVLCTFFYHHHEHFLRALVTGGTAVLLSLGESLNETSTACRRGQATHLMCNPPTAERLAMESRESLAKLRGRLKVIEIGGAVVPGSIVRALQDETGAKVIVAYGSTETSGMALASPWDDAGRQAALHALPGYEVRIEHVDERGIGDLVISGSAVVASYVVPPPGGLRLADGHFYTGDLVQRIGNGLRVLGRVDNAVKTLGGRQSLELVEERLLAALGRDAEAVQCLDVQAQGTSRFLGDSLVALVRLAPEARSRWVGRERQLARRALRAARLQAFLTAPRYLLVVSHDEFRHEGGKLQRRHARQLFPSMLDDWPAERRRRLVACPLLAGDLWRTAARLAGEARALGSPFKVLATVVRRTLAGMLIGRGRAWTESLPRISTPPPIEGTSPKRRWLSRAWLGLRLIIAGYLVALLGLSMAEDSLIYRRGGRHHEPPPDLIVKETWLQTADGVRLHAWFCPLVVDDLESDNQRPVVLFFHGNAGELTRRASVARCWQRALDADVLLFDYRGYGKSEGAPSEDGLKLDSRAAYQWLVEDRGVNPRRIILVGRSLGGAVALELGLAVEHRALVLESTFTSLPDVAALRLPIFPVRVLMRNRFPSVERIREYHGPLFLSHGELDRVIPIEHSNRLYQLANEPKRLLILADQEHVDLPGQGYFQAVREFIESQPDGGLAVINNRG